MAKKGGVLKPMKRVAKTAGKVVMGLADDYVNKRTGDNMITNTMVRTGKLPKEQLEVYPQKMTPQKLKPMKKSTGKVSSKSIWKSRY